MLPPSLFDRKPRYTSRIVSELTGLSRIAMKRYETNGLLVIKRDEYRRKLYSNKDVLTLAVIKQLIKVKKVSSVNGIKVILKQLFTAHKRGLDLFSETLPPRVRNNLIKKLKLVSV